MARAQTSQGLSEGAAAGTAVAGPRAAAGRRGAGAAARAAVAAGRVASGRRVWAVASEGAIGRAARAANGRNKPSRLGARGRCTGIGAVMDRGAVPGQARRG
jgi:hypothetical protein